jgi:hypothetical protein
MPSKLVARVSRELSAGAAEFASDRARRLQSELESEPEAGATFVVELAERLSRRQRTQSWSSSTEGAAYVFAW